jgi:hypothetical protein
MLGPLKRLYRSNSSDRAVDGLCTLDAFHRALEKERCRSDRSDHLYSLLVFALPPGNHSNGNLQRIVRQIRKRIRNVDELGWYDDKRLGIILPYTSREGAEQLAEAICRIISPCVSSDTCVECEIFCYAPDAAARAESS